MTAATEILSHQENWTIQWSPANPQTHTGRFTVTENDYVAVRTITGQRSLRTYPTRERLGHSTVQTHLCPQHHTGQKAHLKAGQVTEHGNINFDHIAQELGVKSPVHVTHSLCDGNNIHIYLCTHADCTAPRVNRNWYSI